MLISPINSLKCQNLWVDDVQSLHWLPARPSSASVSGLMLMAFCPPSPALFSDWVCC